MSDLSKATVNMVKNTISSKSNTSQHENGGYYINKDNESLYLTFGNNRIDICKDAIFLESKVVVGK